MTPIPFARWDLHTIGTLDQVAFQATFPPNSIHAFSLWVYADDITRKQVILSLSSQHELYLEADHLHFSLADGQTLIAPVQAGQWQQVTVTLGQHPALSINGQASPLRTSEAPPIQTESLTLGGYTDPAGGHFDHTFGRNKTGLVDALCLFDAPLSPEAPQARPPVPIGKIESPENPATAPTTLTFSASPSTGEGLTYLWDFGGQQRLIGESVRHPFPYAGDYRVQLTVIDRAYQQDSTEQAFTLSGAENPLRFTPVFVNGTEGYACYRIPAIVRAQNGDLVAFAEGRVDSCSDSAPVIHMVCKRSTDNGRTWLPLQTIVRNASATREHVVHNPSPVLDRNTGRLILLYNKAQANEWEIAKGTVISDIAALYSDDDGATWHSETVLNHQIHRPPNPEAPDQTDFWRVQRPTLGHAIQLRNGRLVHAGMFTTGDASVFQSQNYIFYSDDGGTNWHIAGELPHIGLNEASVVELDSGDLLINSRAYIEENPAGCRALTVARWTDSATLHFEPTRFDPVLVDPAVQGSIIRYSFNDEGQSRLLVSNPAHPHSRYNLTVRLSTDEGQTWPISKVIDPGNAAYSDLVIQADQRIGVLYERGNQGGIYYVNFTLDWLIDTQDSDK
jgi:sialidase-1